MNMFSFDEIKDNADCRDLMVHVLGMRPKSKTGEWWAFSSPLRAGSDGKSFSVCRGAFHDNKDGSKGSALDLITLAKFGGDIWPAQEFLGEYLHLKPCNEAKTKSKFVRAYDYVDAAGNLIHQTIRWDPKAFSQRRPNPEKPGEWINSLSGIEPVLYHLPELIPSPWVCVVGGEKDADNLWEIGIPATTNPMGEGNWRDSYNEYFRGKAVVIFPDLDEVGRRHAQAVAFSIRDIARSVRIIELPFPEDVSPHKDASDYIAYQRAGGHDNADIAAGIKAMVKAAPAIDPKAIKDPPPADPEASGIIEIAKKANKKPFANYDWFIGHDEKGREKKMKAPRHINSLMQELPIRFLGFPCRVGETLFDHDKDSREVKLLDSPQRLFGWIQEKSKQGKEWTKAENFVTESEFFSAMCANAKRYEAISGVPNWPVRSQVYYTHGKMPPPDPAAKRFTEFCQLFSPATEVDWHMLRAFVASPLYWKYKTPRPVWIIDAKDGQGSGKTTVAAMTAFLYGGEDPECGEPNWIAPEKLINEMMAERVQRELLSASARKKRIAIIDNVVGYFKCPELARLITQSSLTGLAPYSHGQETRPNDLTWVITSNSATVDPDISDRSLYLNVCKPTKYVERWTDKVIAFITEHRYQIISDIMGILERGPQFEFNPATRFKDWEYDVLVPILGDKETWETVTGLNSRRQHESDGEIEDAATIRDMLRHRLEQALGMTWEDTPAWIQSSVMSTWVLGAIPKFGGGSPRGCVSNIKNTIKKGRLPELSCDIESWPHNGKSRHRGFMFNAEKQREGKRVYIIGMNGDGSIKTFITPESEE